MNGKPTVIVAEDHPAFLKLVADQLRAAGYEVLEAEDGDALWRALDADEDGRIRLVVSDVRMPVASGFEVLKLTREARPLREVILMTAFSTPAVFERATELGAARVFSKPFPMRELVAEVQRRVPLPSPPGG